MASSRTRMTLTILTELNFWRQRLGPIPRHLVGSLLFPAYKQAQILRSENCFSLRHSMFSEQKQAYESVLLQTKGRGRTTFFSGPNDSAQPSAGRPSAAAVPFFLGGHDSERLFRLNSRFPPPLTSVSLQRSHQFATISPPLRVAHCRQMRESAERHEDDSDTRGEALGVREGLGGDHQVGTSGPRCSGAKRQTRRSRLG
jgi:hypothetical protein